MSKHGLFRYLAPALFAAVLTSTLVAQQGAQTSSGIQWQTDIEAAKAQAQQTGKLVLVHFYTSSCGPCRRLDNTVFSQPSVATPIEARFVPVKLNADAFAAAAQMYEITRVPTDVIITPQGQVVGKLVSPATPTAYVSELTQVANRYSAGPGAGYQQALAAAPFPADSAQLNAAYANLAIGRPPQPTAQPAQQAPTATSGPPMPQAPPIASTAPPASAPQVIGNRYALATSANQPPAAPVATPTAQPANAPASNPVVSPAAPSIAAAPPVTSSTPATAATAATTPPPVPQVAAVNSPPMAPGIPAGSPPVAFGGYCVVSMKGKWQWVQGDAQWGAIHRGRTYLFAGQEQQQQFLANPDYFSPALSGVDPVLAIDESKTIDGKREYSLEYNGLFYLFSSEDSLQRFSANPDRYATGVRQAMGGQPSMVR